jgi:hypothetical protein
MGRREHPSRTSDEPAFACGKIALEVCRLDHDPIGLNWMMISSFCLSMISRFSRGKTGFHFFRIVL